MADTRLSGDDWRPRRNVEVDIFVLSDATSSSCSSTATMLDGLIAGT